MSTSMRQENGATCWTEDMARISRNRDQASFMRIYDHFMPRLCLYLKGLGCLEASAEELSQEALFRLWQRAASFHPERGNLSTWLFRIARNLYFDRVRKQSHWGPMQHELDHIESDAVDTSPPSAEEHADHVDLRRRIRSLPAIQARLMRMSYFEGKTHRQIASELDMPLGTVKSCLRRAFLKLQVAMRGAS